jgi:serine beta-lactamase-like protein LACTB
MRIASISKPITSLIAAKLYEENKLDFDKSIDFYLPHLPTFKYNEKLVKITTRQLISHTSGIRHYEKKNEINNEKSEGGSDTSLKEFYIKENFKTTKDALELFIKDELLSEPGTEFFYTTHGFTLLSAVLEKISGRSSFSKLLLDLFQVLNMKETYLDQNDPLIKNRSK